MESPFRYFKTSTPLCLLRVSKIRAYIKLRANEHKYSQHCWANNVGSAVHRG